MSITHEHIRQYKDAGFVVVSGLLDAETVQEMTEHYMKVRAEGPKPGDFGGTADQPEDPTHKYPRLINMHNWDDASKRWALREELLEAVEQLIEDTPALQQTMLYFKPPGGRGQGLHQDQQYITIEPLIGVWVALDPSDKDVGQMVVVPGSHKLGLVDVESADTSRSFTNVQAVLPSDAEQFGVNMKSGDVLFFHGKTIHGSYPNVTADRWRRSFICHYIGKHAERFTPSQGKHVSHLNAKR